MNPFLSTLIDVLSEKPEIKALPMDKLISSDAQGEAVIGNIDKMQLLKLVRLQTLKELEISMVDEPPSFAEVSEMAKQAGVNFGKIEVKNMCVRADSVDRILMLERLIVELVRSIFPKESDVFDVSYHVTLTPQIIRQKKHRSTFC